MSVKVPRSLMSLKSTVQVFQVKIAVVHDKFHLWQVNLKMTQNTLKIKNQPK